MISSGYTGFRFIPATTASRTISGNSHFALGSEWKKRSTVIRLKSTPNSCAQ